MTISSLFSFSIFRRYAQFCSRKFGYELVGEIGATNLLDCRFFPRKLSFPGLRSNEDPYKEPFRVKMNLITSRVGFSYADEGWHPFVETLKEYAENKSLKYEDSTLAFVYEKYCPRNVQEVLLDHLEEPLEPFCSWPPVNDLLRWVWALNTSSAKSYLRHAKKRQQEEGWIYFGPHSPEYGKKEFTRLISVYNSIEAKGYQSELTTKDPVNGYFLKNEDNLRFVLLQGNHRVAALNALGYSDVDVVIRKGHPAVVDRKDLKKWTRDFGGIYSSYLVRVLFDTLFSQTGTEKALRLGLKKEPTWQN